MTQVKYKPREQKLVRCRECGVPMVLAKSDPRLYCDACDTPEVKLRARMKLLKQMQEER